MRNLFLQLFLAFWISTIGICCIATALFPDGEHGSLPNIFSFAQEDAERVNKLAVDAYLRYGCNGVYGMGEHYSLADGNGSMFCEGRVTAKTHDLILQVAEHGTVKGLHDDGKWITATPITRPEGNFVVIHERPYMAPSYLPHPLASVALPVSLAVTLLFAFFLTRPARQLSDAFRRFSAGDLSVRLPAKPKRLAEFGGTDVRTLMLDFNHMAEQVHQLLQSHRALVRDVSHELRSPLSRLRLALEMARRESGAELPSFDRMETEMSRLNDLVGQMLTLSLMENTRALADTEPVDVVDLIESLLPNLEFEAATHACSISLVVTQPSIFVDGNSELLRRAIENVARNAVRYTAKGSIVSIRVWTEREELLSPESGFIVALDLDDGGPGVPEEALRHLFKAFYRTDDARRDVTGGFGVGLSIAERSVLLHRGTIHARNREGGGLTVSIRLPSSRHMPRLEPSGEETRGSLRS